MATGKINFLAFGAEVVEKCRLSGRLGTARNYERTLSSFGTFISGRTGAEDITLGEMTGDLMMKYERWLAERGVVRNSSSFYMRNLRSIFNKAPVVGSAGGGTPFRNVYTGIDRTRKRAAGEDLLVRMQRMDLGTSSALAMARDLFVFSYCMRGMAFVDLAFLRKADIKGGVVSYVRKKTGKRLNVRLEPCMEQIIRRYEHETSGSPYVFPIIASPDPEIAYMQYRIALNYHNRKLKRLAEKLGEKQPLSSYITRHTWATAARNRNVPISVISAGMGHASEKTTRIYLAALEESVIDNANRRILGKLNDWASI